MIQNGNHDCLQSILVRVYGATADDTANPAQMNGKLTPAGAVSMAATASGMNPASGRSDDASLFAESLNLPGCLNDSRLRIVAMPGEQRTCQG